MKVVIITVICSDAQYGKINAALWQLDEKKQESQAQKSCKSVKNTTGGLNTDIKLIIH